MGLFSKFRENAVDCGEERGEQSEGEREGKESGSVIGEKGLMESVGEMLEHSVHNVKEAVFGHMDSGGEGEIGSLPRALAMEDPFSQSDHVLVAVIEHDVRSASVSDGHEEDAQRKTIVQTVRENLAHSAHIVRDAVLSHTTDHQPNGSQFAQAATPIEVGDKVLTPVPGGTDDHRRTIIEAMGEIMSHPVQTVKDIIGSHNDVVESSPVDPSTATPKQESLAVDRKSEEHEEDEEAKGLIQTVKEAAQEVKEEMMEVVQEVKDVVMSNDTLPNVQTGAFSILFLHTM
jgi:hypothetical protein